MCTIVPKFQNSEYSFLYNMTASSMKYISEKDLNPEWTNSSSENIVYVKANPQNILNGCRQNVSLFKAPIDDSGSTVMSKGVSLLSSLVGSMLNNVTGSSGLGKSIKLPDFSSQIQNISSINLSSIDFGNLNIPSSFGFNLTNITQTLNNTGNSLTPQSVSPDMGNPVTLQTNLNNFNNMAGYSSPSAWTAWDYTFIVQNFIVPNIAFNPVQNVTNNVAHSNNTALTTMFAASIYPRVGFIYYANNALDKLKQNITVTVNLLVGLQNNQITPVQNKLSTLTNSIPTIKGNVNSLSASIDTIVYTDVPMITPALTDLISHLLNKVLQILSGAIPFLIDSLIDAGSGKFGQCHDFAEDLIYTEKALCISFVGSLEALWLSYLLIAVTSVYKI
jgi:hypothetical protein